MPGRQSRCVRHGVARAARCGSVPAAACGTVASENMRAWALLLLGGLAAAARRVDQDFEFDDAPVSDLLTPPLYVYMYIRP